MSSLRKKTDHELIQDFQDGDLYALETLILRHKEKMYTSILFLVKDKYLAEDIFQDVLIKIIEALVQIVMIVKRHRARMRIQAKRTERATQP